MVALTRLIGVAVRWLTRSRRSMIATVAVPILVVIALLTPRSLGADRSSHVAGGGSGAAAGGSAAVTTTELAPVPSTVLPAATGRVSGPVVPPRGTLVLPAGAAAVATDYVVAVNSHDARPGGDSGPLDSYARARTYVTPELYKVITAPSSRGSYEWAQWVQAKARVTVQIVHAAVPDGAPAPTATTAYVRVQFRQLVTPAVAGQQPQATDGSLAMVVTKGQDQKWLVSQLLAGD